MSSLPVPSLCVSFIVIAPAVRTLGPRAERKFAVTRSQEESSRTRSRLLEERSATSQSPGCLRMVARTSCRACPCVHASKNWMAGCLRPPPASSGEEAENRRVTAAQKPRQLGPSPALPTVTLFADAACRLIGPIRRTLPCQPLRLRHSLASRAANGRALTRLPHNKVHAETCGLVCAYPQLSALTPFDDNKLQIIAKSLSSKTVPFPFKPAFITAHDQRPVELARAPAALPPRTCPPPGKPLRAFRRRNNARPPGRVVVYCHPSASPNH
jgi:hypothetical protein